MLLLSRPPTNAMTRQVYREIVAAADELGRRDDVAAVILFGGHEIFSAGDDMPELRTLTAAEAGTAARVRRQAVEAVAAIPKPTVAAITGYALGAGLTLALAADWRVSGDNVKFGATEILAGLIPGGGGMARLTRAVGAEQGQGAGVQRALLRRRGGVGAGPDRRHGGSRRRLRRRGGLGEALPRRARHPRWPPPRPGSMPRSMAPSNPSGSPPSDRRYIDVFAAGQDGRADAARDDG